MSKKKILNKKLKDRWVKALRSGEYKQAKGCLCSRDEVVNGNNEVHYCCLGVLKHIVTGRNDFKRAMYYGPNRELYDSDKFTIAERLAEKNDDGQSFKRIAIWIEKNL